MEDTADRLIRRILRVNHAGEHGAISIYSAQIGRLGREHSDLMMWLDETRDHERSHRRAFLEAMPSRGAKPCRALAVWSVGGWLLGSLTAALGRDGIMACTVAVERTVHGHLQQQIAYLTRHDPTLAELVVDIQRDEQGHLEYAQSHLADGSALGQVLSPIISCATEILIAISTRGDSLRLQRALNLHG
jgi:ubiquinone biosynthesis monooxygenase Coq7